MPVENPAQFTLSGQALIATDVKSFAPLSVEFTGRFELDGPITEVFNLFSPLGERLWVHGWSPELLHPPGVSWQRGQIFRTRSSQQETLWIVTDLDPSLHRVEYHRLDPERHVARVRVHCSERAMNRNEITVSYLYVGLSDTGNAEIGEMTNAAFQRKIEQWKTWIDGYRGRSNK